MNQASNETAGADLPIAPPEQLPAPVETDTAALPEQTAAAEQAPQPSQGAPMGTPTWPTDLYDNSTATTDDVTSTTQVTTLADVEEKDLIDKAVVEKAKAIVARTAENPYQQTQEISELKAEFLQHNYNKVIKLSKQ